MVLLQDIRVYVCSYQNKKSASCLCFVCTINPELHCWRAEIWVVWRQHFVWNANMNQAMKETRKICADGVITWTVLNINGTAIIQRCLVLMRPITMFLLQTHPLPSASIVVISAASCAKMSNRKCVMWIIELPCLSHRVPIHWVR